MSKVHIAPGKVHETLGHHILADGLHIVFDLEKSHGAIVHDAVSGKDFIDLFSFFASQPIALNHPRMNNPETIELLGRVALHKPTNSDIYTREMAEYVETFARIAKPPEFKYMFFIEGGALAVENALKTAFDWKARKNLARGLPERDLRVIHFEDCFHGRTGYTMSMTDSFDPRKTMYFPKFDWPRVVNPRITFPLEGENLKAVEGAEACALAQIKKIFEEDPHGIAAIVIETIQGEGGDNHFRDEFLQELRKICDEHEALYILDEIQAGLGLTGKMWAYQHFGFTPDIVAFGKKTQVCGIMATDRIDDVDNVFKISSRLNSTWGGNLVDMVRSKLHLEIIEDEKLVDRAAETGEYLLKRLLEMQSELGGFIDNARGRGLMCAFSLPDADTRKDAEMRIIDNGVIMLPCGGRSLRFRPTLDISRDALDKGLSTIESVLKEMATAHKV
jgi:L-lysine 6-transaminase